MNQHGWLAQTGAAPWLADLDPRLKVGWLLYISMMAVLVESVAALCSVLLLAALPLVGLRIRISHAVAIGGLLAVVAWTTMLTQAMFYDAPDRTELATIVVPLYHEGFIYGLTQSTRLLSGTLAGIAVCVSTSHERLLAAMSAWRAPPMVGFIVATAIRFLPATLDEYLAVRQARALRGYRFRIWGPPGRRWQSWWVEVDIVAPLVATSLRRAAALAVSITSRGFEPARRPTVYPPLQWRGGERAALVAFALVIAIVAACKTIVWLAPQWNLAFTRFVNDWL